MADAAFEFAMRNSALSIALHTMVRSAGLCKNTYTPRQYREVQKRNITLGTHLLLDPTHALLKLETTDMYHVHIYLRAHISRQHDSASAKATTYVHCTMSSASRLSNEIPPR